MTRQQLETSILELAALKRQFEARSRTLATELAEARAAQRGHSAAS
jgi:hypothetical protein